MPNEKVTIENGGNRVVYPESIKDGGTPAWRNNNAGNLKYGSFAKSHGAIGFNGEFAVFPNIKTGEDAQVANLKTEKFQSQSIAGAISIYASREDHNDTEKYIKTVAGWTGMSRDKTLSSMTPQEFDNFVGGIRRYEGAKPGTEYIVPKGMKGFAVLSPKEISQLKTSRRPLTTANPVKHHSHAGALAGRTLRRVGNTVYRIENGRSKGSFVCSGKKK